MYNKISQLKRSHHPHTTNNFVSSNQIIVWDRTLYIHISFSSTNNSTPVCVCACTQRIVENVYRLHQNFRNEIHQTSFQSCTDGNEKAFNLSRIDYRLILYLRYRIFSFIPR